MKRALLVLIFIFLVSPLFAETITLKSGQTIEGKILERTDEYIKVDFEGVGLTYFLDEIESIDGKKIMPSKEEKSILEKTINKDELLEKIKSASKNIKRIQSRTIEDTEIKGFMHTKSEKITDMDFAQKIMHSTTTIKEYAFHIKDFDKAVLERKILEARQKGIPEEKIQEMRKSMEKLGLETQKMMDEMAKKLVGTKTESFLMDRMIYTNIKDKWIKMDFPLGEVFWKIWAKSQEGKIDKEDFKQMLEKSPPGIKEAMEPLVSRLDVGRYEDIYDIDSISESDFLGTPCYVLEVKAQDMVDTIKESLLALFRAKGEKEIKASIGSFTYKEFISKRDYLRLGSKLNVVISLSTPDRYSMTADMRVETVYSYPTGRQIQLLPELSQAIPVKDEEEFKKKMIQDITSEIPSELKKQGE